MFGLIWMNKGDEIDQSHKMGDWKQAVRTPTMFPRFYQVRQCKGCGSEEGDHPTGRYVEPPLMDHCTGDPT